MKDKTFSFHTVDAEVGILLKGEDDWQTVKVEGLPFVWEWDSMSRDSSAYWAVMKYIYENYDYDFTTIKWWSTTKDEGGSDAK